VFLVFLALLAPSASFPFPSSSSAAEYDCTTATRTSPRSIDSQTYSDKSRSMPCVALWRPVMWGISSCGWVAMYPRITSLTSRPFDMSGKV
jgi:hypothetical protein